MAANEVHLNDIGTIFELTMLDGTDIVDVSGALSMEIMFLKPTIPATKVTKTAVFKTNGADGIIQYVTVDGDLDTLGKWKIQGKVQLNTGTWSSDISSFKVYDNL